MTHHRLEALESRNHLAILADAAALLPGVRGTQTVYADLNGDSIVDAIGRTDRGWVVDLGNARGRFTPAAVLPALRGHQPGAAEWLVPGRWTAGDDTVDLALVRAASGTMWIRVLSNNGNAVFTARNGRRVEAPTQIATIGTIAEVRGGDTGGSQLTWNVGAVLQGVVFNSRGQITSTSTLSNGVQSWSIADFNADGADEILVSRTLEGTSTADIAHRPDGSWSFTAVTGGADARFHLFAGDINGDERPDIAWASGLSVTLMRGTTLPNSTTFSFDAPVLHIPLTATSPDDSYSLRPDRSIIFGASRLDSDQPPSLIVQTYAIYHGRVDVETVANVLLRPSGAPGAQTWRRTNLGGEFGNVGATNRSMVAHRTIDIGGDGQDDLVLGNTARRVLPESDVTRPTIGRLSADPLDPDFGVRTLVASDFADLNGKIASVRFYYDANDDGQWSPIDPMIYGRVTTSPDGTRRIRLDTDHFYTGPGPARFFARAWDDQGFVSLPTSVDLMIPEAPAPDAAAPGEIPETAPDNRTVVSTSNSELPIATADFTGDGRPDILRLQRGSRGSQRLVLLVGRQPPVGNPDILRFDEPRIIAEDDVVHGLETTHTIVGRFTSGDDLDIAVLRYRGDGRYETVMLINDGRGNFTVGAEKTLDRFSRLSTPHSPDGADHPQSLVASRFGGGVVSLSFDDQGRILSEQLVSRTSAAFAAADFNSDGRDELLVSRGPTFQLLEPRARGGYRISSIAAMTTPHQSGFKVGDVDGDGTPDLVIVGATYTDNQGTSAEMWVQVHRLASQAGRVRVVESREILRDRFESQDLSDFGIAILGVGDATGDAAADVTVELLTATVDSPHVRVVIIEQPWSTGDNQPHTRTVLRHGRPSGTYVWINTLFRMADVDHDDVLDLFRRDQSLELYRGL